MSSLPTIYTSKGERLMVVSERNGTGLEVGVNHGKTVLTIRYQCEECEEWNEGNTSAYYCKPNHTAKLWAHFCTQTCYSRWSKKKVGEALAANAKAVHPAWFFSSGAV